MRIVPGARVELAPGDDPGDMRQERFDISAAAHDLSYRPRVTLEDGIRTYLDWLKRQEASK